MTKSRKRKTCSRPVLGWALIALSAFTLVSCNTAGKGDFQPGDWDNGFQNSHGAGSNR